MSIYIGDNVHDYTTQLREIIPKYFDTYINEKVDNTNWETVLSEIKLKYPNMPAVYNIERNYNNGLIFDPDLPNINSANLLLLIWNIIKNNTELSNHFLETLKQIDNTCIQGISHRLIIDYIALYNDIYEQSLLFYFNNRIKNIVESYII